MGKYNGKDIFSDFKILHLVACFKNLDKINYERYFYLDFFLSLPCLIRILVPQHSFCFHLHAIFFSLTFSQCVLSSKENLCEQHNDGSSFLFSQPSYVFWLEHLVYWCLKLLLIGTNIAILLPVFWLLLQFFSVLSFISRLTCGLIIFFSVTFGLSP